MTMIRPITDEDLGRWLSEIRNRPPGPDLPMPNGKPLRECTHEELLELRHRLKDFEHGIDQIDRVLQQAQESLERGATRDLRRD